MSLGPEEEGDATTPLLPSQEPPERPAQTSKDGPSTRSYVGTMIGLCAVILILDMSTYISIAPEVAIVEQIVCRNHYSSSGALGDPTQDCKAEAVQSEVALLIGWKNALETIPGVLCAIPYGVLADRIGREKVLVLSVIGCVLGEAWVRLVYWFTDVFPLHAVWFSGVWQLLGGGATTLSAVVFAIVADLSPPEKRMAAFSYIQASLLMSEFLAVTASAFLMDINPWIPYLSALCLLFLGTLMSFFIMPGNAKSSQPLHVTSDQSSVETPLLEDPNSDDRKRHKFGAGRALAKLRNALVQGWESSQWIREHSDLFLILVSFFVFPLSVQVVSVLLQFASNKFGWTYSQASYLLSLRSGASLLALTVALPALSKFLSHSYDGNLMKKDHRLTQLCALAVVCGSLLTFFGMSPALFVLGQVIFSFGSGLAPTARSLITGLVDQSHLGVLYTGISVVTYCGVFMGGPLLAKTYSWGLQLNDRLWIGLPFLVTAALFFLALVAVSLTRLRNN